MWRSDSAVMELDGMSWKVTECHGTSQNFLPDVSGCVPAIVGLTSVGIIGGGQMDVFYKIYLQATGTCMQSLSTYR